MPRRRAAPRAAVADLRDVSLLTVQTQNLHSKSLEAFSAWLAGEGIVLELATLFVCSSLTDRLLEAFGAHLFKSDVALYVYLMAVTAAQAQRPQLRRCLPLAWKLASTWEAIEPGEHRRPLPVTLYRALVVAAVSASWLRFACVLILTFLGPARVGEVLRATRKSLVLPVDVLFDPDDRLYLEIEAPKSRFRGGGARQHICVVGRLEVAFVSACLLSLTPGEPLYPFTAATFRSRWDSLLKRLTVPSCLAFTPASLRAGGTVYAYNHGASVQDLLWRLRLQHQRTLAHYLQEVATATSLVTVSPATRALILKSASLYAPLLSTATPLVAQVGHGPLDLHGL